MLITILVTTLINFLILSGIALYRSKKKFNDDRQMKLFSRKLRLSTFEGKKQAVVLVALCVYEERLATNVCIDGKIDKENLELLLEKGLVNVASSIMQNQQMQ